MIPSEVAAIAELICQNWSELEDDASHEVLHAAYRIYEAGYRVPEPVKPDPAAI